MVRFVPPISVVCLFLCFGGAARAGEEVSEWWSFQALQAPRLPGRVASEEEARTPIDGWILASLKERGLEMTAEATPEVLLRRVFYDLLGLPPTPEEVERFLDRGTEPQAYARLVDRLLASPRYGERWARHWLDVVHYGETHGYDKDKPRPHAYPYRDYVIRAFNEDRPYGRFVQEQIAGDALWPETADGVEATGFLAAGPWDFIGHAEVPEDKIDGKVARHLDRDDMVKTTMNAFCSLTVQCAQCHDHKRDPVTMEHYYSLQAVFAALDRTDREYDPDPEVARRRVALEERLEVAQTALQGVEERLDEGMTEEALALSARLAAVRASREATGEVEGKERSPQFGYHSEVADSSRMEKWVQVDLGRELAVDKVVLVGADEYGFADFGFPAAYRVEVSMDEDFGKAEKLFESVEGSARPGARPVVIGGGGRRARYLRVTATELWNRRQRGQEETGDWIFALGEIAVLSDGEAVAMEGVKALDSIEAPPRWGRMNVMDGIYGRYGLQDRAPEGLTAWLEAASGGVDGETEESLEAALEEELRRSRPGLMEERDRWRSELAQAEEAIGRLPEPSKVYAGTVHTGSGAFKGRGHLGGAPRPIHVLHRGDVTQPKELVRPATVPGIVASLPSAFELPEDHRESDRRVALARWITHQENTLTWRSIVNRIWHYHFGRGLVDTPNDFGRIGSQPSHPDLLDWLAKDFRDGGGSMKRTHRLVMLSAVYRQGSGHREEAAEVDGSNQFLWRQNRRRLEAEAIRDTVLWMAGKLDGKMYGPSFMDFVIEKPEHSPHYQYHKADPDDPTTHRRSVYRFLVRSQPQPFMDTLDCADPSQLVDRRGETNTALQALAMLNNALMVRMAEHFACRLEAESPGDPVGRAFLLALSREPTGEERRLLGDYAREHGLAAMCRLVFNMNEFSFVD